MFIFRTSNTDPKLNLAIEEFLTKNKVYKEPILFLWQNKNTIVIGRNQNTVEEVNIVKAKEDKVTIIRRNTGGGAVFHDLGNLNFSIIYTDVKNNAVSMFEQMLEPIIKTLKDLGINAQFSGRNDIQVNGKKISGNAMWKWKDRFLQHGTILVNSDLAKIAKYLTVDRSKIVSKNIESISSRVTNINNESDKEIDVQEFINLIINTYQSLDSVKELVLSKSDYELIQKIKEEKYDTEEWTFNKHSTFTYKNKTRLEGKGLVEVLLDIQEGLIKNAKIYGDFLGFKGTLEFEQLLLNKKYSLEVLRECVESSDIENIFGNNFSSQDILDLLIQ
ncbi:lipoate protein ligase A [Spiroplasma chinense]|uniref:lipoate--protein ligase n=1 Tax=Spiroplasma chinense TaxID=216932 RepID=A0A5B9Y5C7_9MOLU|nr:lipoate--protein ligase [Spiroplasma chinense]QEH62025.1 lipoate protein ligase A [Spiroplasma chinense]